jgi:hypothetical protein
MCLSLKNFICQKIIVWDMLKKEETKFSMLKGIREKYACQRA